MARFINQIRELKSLKKQVAHYFSIHQFSSFNIENSITNNLQRSASKMNQITESSNVNSQMMTGNNQIGKMMYPNTVTTQMSQSNQLSGV